jgi:hypothetical protein
MQKYQKSFIVFIFAIFLSVSTHSQNITMEISKINCDKIDNVSTKYLDEMTESIGVPKRSIRLEGGVWSDLNGCSVLFSTPKGLYKCIFSHLLSSDNGKTTFPAGFGSCEKMN